MINVKELNVCGADSWKNEFKQNDFFQQIASNYVFTVFSHREMTILKAALHHTVYETPRVFLEDYRILDAVPYYYIKFLLEKQPKVVVDLGCGINNFKPYIPGLIGIDCSSNIKTYDVFDHFDQDFVAGHQQFCDALMSINAIHFSPIDTVTQRLKWTSELIRPGGRGFVATNLETWLMHTPAEQIKKLFGACPKFDDILNYVDEQIIATGLDFIVVDWPVLHGSEHSTIRDELNGNIRLVFNV